jgi:hypothetical protein
MLTRSTASNWRGRVAVWEQLSEKSSGLHKIATREKEEPEQEANRSRQGIKANMEEEVRGEEVGVRGIERLKK